MPPGRGDVPGPCALRRGGEFSREGWTQVERDLLDELGWWSLDDLERLEAQTEVFPAGLSGLVRGLLPGWDGTTRHLGLGRD
ncbi:hypothetical protein [Cellulomonas soli]